MYKRQEHRHHQQRQDHHRDHAAHHAGAERLLALRAGAAGDHHRQHAADEGETGHQDRPEAQMAGLHGRLQQRLALGAQVLGEFDDQDGVLGREPNDRHEANREVDVVGQAAGHRRDHRAADAERHRHQHRDRDRPAFIERGQTQEHHQRRQAQQERRLRSRQLLLQRLSRPFEAEAARQLRGELLHLGDGVTRGEAGTRRAADAHRGVIVEADDLGRSHRPFDGREGGERHQLTATVLDVVGQDVVRIHPAGAVDLHDHTLHAAAIGEVVDVVRPEIGRNRAVDVGERHAERSRLFAIDQKLHQWRFRQAFGIDVLQHAASLRRRKQLILRLHQRTVTLLAAVLQTETESAGIAEVVDRRRLQRRDLGVADR